MPRRSKQHTRWRLVPSSIKYSRSGHLTFTKHTVVKRALGGYSIRLTFYKKGMIKYRYSGSNSKLDMETGWMRAPHKWRASHRKKRGR